VAEQQPGLRFDIYERVHLQEGVEAIRELNDVELNPHIQVLTHGEQAVLQGNLVLSGTYVSENGEDIRALEHLIPVEITLPLNRIHRVEDILVEIENFDVDLLSSRSLNVTGVLSLQGVEMLSTPADTWKDEEEVTFVHEAAETTRSEPAPAEPTTPAEPAEQTVVPAPQVVTSPPTIQAPLIAAEPLQAAPVETNAAEATAAETTPDIEMTEPVDEDLKVDAEITEIKVVADPEAGTLVTEEKKEVKLAFGKKANEAVDIKPYGIKSLISKASSMITGDKRKEEATATQEENKTESVEWKRLFLQSGEEAQEFRKVRMCIVQKEETLDTIAQRYQLNPRELQLLNRLSEKDITPGQIIYLPR
jgi:stage VI sporulation protein D